MQIKFLKMCAHISYSPDIYKSYNARNHCIHIIQNLKMCVRWNRPCKIGAPAFIVVVFVVTAADAVEQNVCMYFVGVRARVNFKAAVSNV